MSVVALRRLTHSRRRQMPRFCARKNTFFVSSITRGRVYYMAWGSLKQTKKMQFAYCLFVNIFSVEVFLNKKIILTGSSRKEYRFFIFCCGKLQLALGHSPYKNDVLTPGGSATNNQSSNNKRMFGSGHTCDIYGL